MTMNKTDRRHFLEMLAAVAGSAAAGCRSGIFGSGVTGAPMQGFAAPPIPRLRVGVVGLGGRGNGAIYRLIRIPGVEVTAVCDAVGARVDERVAWFRDAGYPVPRGYAGPEAYKAMCESDIDVVYNTTSWNMHVPIALYAMEHGKHAMVEVPSAFTVEGCWALVETAERTRRHCMQLENCCYGEMEMLMLNLCRKGMLGEIVHGEGGYIHDLRNLYTRVKKDTAAEGLADGPNRDLWRLRFNSEHKGDQYPTHGLGPICNCMNINRGDRLDYLVSLESDQFNFEAYAKANYPADSWRANLKVAMGDVNMTLVRTACGRSIFIKHDISCPQPYTRLNVINGTKGVFMDFPYRVGWEDRSGSQVRRFFDETRAAEVRETYKHPLWKQIGEHGVKVGGHGGMDFIMDLRWCYCLQNGLPLDMDVYDLASWCALGELTERSVRNRSSSESIPDFTRGAWKIRRDYDIGTLDLSKLDFTQTVAARRKTGA